MMDLLNVDLNSVRNGKVKRSDKIEPLLGLNYRGVLDAATNVPVVGDVLSGGLAAYDLSQGDYGSAALNALGVLPFLSAGMIKKAGKVADAVNTPKLTEFEQRHLIAQRNAALPVEQGGLGLPPNNTAMDRARAMGAVDAYHGTQKPFEQFDPSLSNTARKTGVPSDTVVVSSSPNIANTYAADPRRLEWSPDFAEGANVMPLMVIKGNNESISGRGRFWNEIPQTKKYPDVYDVNDFASAAKEQGFDSATVRNVIDSARLKIAKDKADTTFVFNPANIRSRFAAFDPMRRHEADLLGYADPRLLGAIAGGGLLGLGGYSLLDQ